MTKHEVNFRPADRQVAIRYPHFFKYKYGTNVFLDDLGKKLDQERMIHRPHEIIAIGTEAAERMNLAAGDYVYLNPTVMQPGTGSLLLELDVRCLCIDYNYIIGNAVYTEEFEKADAEREQEQIRQEELDKNMVGRKAR